jgi:hypothetical protein
MAFNPRGSKSAPLLYWTPTAAFTGLIAAVVILFTGIGAGSSATPWQILSRHGVQLAPKSIVFSVFYPFMLLLCFGYVAFHALTPGDVHARQLAAPFAGAFVLETIAWIVLAYNFVTLAAVVSALAAFWLLYGYARFYKGCASCPPNMATYWATSAPLSSYLGWLIFNATVLLNAALTKDTTLSSFLAPSERGPIATAAILAAVVFTIAFQYYDPHLVFFVILGLIGTYTKLLDTNTGDLVHVVGPILGFMVGAFAFAIPLRFLSEKRRQFIRSDTVSYTSPPPPPPPPPLPSSSPPPTFGAHYNTPGAGEKC